MNNYIQVGNRLINLNAVTLIWLNKNSIHYHFLNEQKHITEYETSELAAQHFNSILTP